MPVDSPAKLSEASPVGTGTSQRWLRYRDMDGHEEGTKEQQQGMNRSSSFYSATNRFAIVLEPSVLSGGCFVKRKRSFRFRFVS